MAGLREQAFQIKRRAWCSIPNLTRDSMVPQPPSVCAILLGVCSCQALVSPPSTAMRKRLLMRLAPEQISEDHTAPDEAFANNNWLTTIRSEDEEGSLGSISGGERAGRRSFHGLDHDDQDENLLRMIRTPQHENMDDGGSRIQSKSKWRGRMVKQQADVDRMSRMHRFYVRNLCRTCQYSTEKLEIS